jgi:hypothetical protein
MYKRNCPVCNKELTYTQKHNWKFAEENNTRCSHCRVVNRNGKIIGCSWCKNPIYRLPSQLKKRPHHFCSHDCQCKFASKYQSGKNNKLWKGGKDNNRKKYRELINNRVVENKKRVINILGGKCKMCGYNKCINALECHHINPKEKDIDICKLLSKTWGEKIEKEIKKCDLLCSNCHKEHHHNEKLNA